MYEGRKASSYFRPTDYADLRFSNTDDTDVICPQITQIDTDYLFQVSSNLFLILQPQKVIINYQLSARLCRLRSAAEQELLTINYPLGFAACVAQRSKNYQL